MNKYTLTGLSVAGGVLTGLAWTNLGTGLMLLAGFVPFLMIEDHICKNRKKYSENAVFLYILPGYVIFSLIAIGWLRAISIVAALTVIMCVSLIMTFIWWSAHKIRIRAGLPAGYLSLTAFWLLYEFLCLNSGILSPWLNLGNGLAKDILFIQWYEFTGAPGGTFWIIVSNLFLWLTLSCWQQKKPKRLSILSAWLLIIAIPSILSIMIFANQKSDESTGNEVVIVQPNYDPYFEKYSIPFKTQLEKALKMAESAATPSTSWIVMPETVVDDPVNELTAGENDYIRMIKALNVKFPQVNTISGMVTYIPGGADENDIRGSINDNVMNDAIRFNSALNIGAGDKIEIYHKSKLVPGFENIPVHRFFRFINLMIPVLGNANWDYGVQEEREVFTGSGQKSKVAPLICYESVFGEYVTGYVNKGAEALFIITNDGWWKNTSGYKQHLSFASIRAIETRRPVVRSANTGISCFIDTRGRITRQTEWWNSSVLTGKVYPQQRITVYARYGDIILRSALLTSILILIWIFFAAPLRKKIKKQ
ncbi:MAG: apolipoprotein N-acyltransferase [Bacteroidales bacterium]|nr:apolipoprotein N-acyltransferase [Bacteroidales bacterium]